MAKFNVHQCPICEHKIFSAFISCKDYFVSGEVFHIKKCNNCGFAITGNIDDEENIDYFYKSDKYISHSDSEEGLLNELYHLVRNYMLGRKHRLVNKVTGMNNGKLLDVGAGTGYFLNHMNRRGWQVTGTEKNTAARKFAKSEFNLDLLETNDLFELKDNSFDVITLWHVLEHIHRLPENMETFHRLLKPMGRLIIAVPNHDSYDALYYEEFWAAWDVPRHIWHFKPKQMKMLGEKFGFRLRITKPMPFDAFYVSILSEQYKKSKFAIFKGIYRGKLSWIRSMFRPEKSSSVIYIFSKN